MTVLGDDFQRRWSDVDKRIGFLRARLDEDEAAAKAATRLRVHNPEPWYTADDKRFPWPEDATHVACHDPARVLREVAAKRAILDECERTLAYEDYGLPLADYVLGQMATVYSHHPDYGDGTA